MSARSNQCREEPMRKLLTFTAIAALAAVTINTAGQGGAQAAPKRPDLVPFSATAAADEEVDILRHGPLTLYLGCRPDFAFLGIRTTADATMITSHSRHIFGPSGVDEVAVLVGIRPPSDSGGVTNTANEADHQAIGVSDFAGSGTSAITPTGHVLTVPADAVLWGVRARHHPDAAGTLWEDSPDCFVTGHALLSRVRVLPR
jgi:hypothetical protein